MAGVRQRLTDAKIEVVERLRPWAEARGHTTAELAVAWLLAHPEVSTVIIGARTAAQVKQNATFGAWELTQAEREEVTALASGGA